MSFFRRGDDKPGARPSYEARSSSYEPRQTTPEPVRMPAVVEQPRRETHHEAGDYEALGNAMELHKQSSSQLVASIESLQAGLASMIEDHGRSLDEVGKLRAEQAQFSGLLQQESALRLRLDGENARLITENRDVTAEAAQLRVEADTFRQEFNKLQALHQMVSDERAIFETRLFDIEGELRAQIRQYDEASLLMTRAQQELDARNRELAALREKLETETTAHQMLVESSTREMSTLSRELTRVTDERNQLKTSLVDHEAQLRSMQISLGNSRQETAAQEERYKRLETEFENHQASSALERAQMISRHEAMNSKVLLAEKLLATANGRNRVTDDELHETRSELKRMKTDFATLTSRSERANEEVARSRAIGAESEAARRELAAQANLLTIRLREAEDNRVRRERETEIFKRDMESRAETDRFELNQLRTSVEIAMTEARQIKTENAILTGQLEAARHERARSATTTQSPATPVEERDWENRPTAGLPIIDLSESALRNESSPR